MVMLINEEESLKMHKYHRYNQYIATTLHYSHRVEWSGVEWSIKRRYWSLLTLPAVGVLNAIQSFIATHVVWDHNLGMPIPQVFDPFIDECLWQSRSQPWDQPSVCCECKTEVGGCVCDCQKHRERQAQGVDYRETLEMKESYTVGAEDNPKERW